MHEMVVGVAIMLELALSRDAPLELGPQFVPLRERLFERGLGAAGSFLRAHGVFLVGRRHRFSARRGAARR